MRATMLAPIRRGAAAAACVLALWGCGGARGELPAGLSEFDMNGNGLIEEAEVGPVMRPRFGAFDRDGSGALEPGELRRLLLEQAGARMRRAGARTVEPWDAARRASPAQIEEQLRDMTDALDVQGAALVCGARGAETYRGFAGAIEPSTSVPVASASKWISAIVVMQAVEAGRVTLEAPLWRYLPQASEGWREVTLLQMFSHTSGAPHAHAMRYSPDAPPADVAGALVAHELVARPGTSFGYGGESMQVGAFAVETASAASWRELFARGVGDKLGLRDTRYGHPIWHDPGREIVAPNVAAGLWSSANDYFRILSALAFPTEETRLLSDQSMATIETDYSSALTQAFRPAGVLGEWSYGLGLWCERREGARCVSVSSAGAYGTYPWLDRAEGGYGVLVTLGDVRSVMPFALRLRAMCASLGPPG